MLSDEEKEAIEILGEFKKNGFHLLNLKYESRVSTTKHIENSIEIILNLIEKQSKEIEEYKKQLDLDYVDKHFVPVERYNQLEKEIEELKKQLDLDNECEIALNNRIMDLENADKKWADKIKAKIEEVDKDENASIPDFIEYAKEYATQKLQSLLEKE